jgi:hypothetical protein
MSREQEIDAIFRKLSSPEFNALRLRVKTEDTVGTISPWCESSERERDGAKLDPDTKRDQGSR